MQPGIYLIWDLFRFPSFIMRLTPLPCLLWLTHDKVLMNLEHWRIDNIKTITWHWIIASFSNLGLGRIVPSQRISGTRTLNCANFSSLSLTARMSHQTWRMAIDLVWVPYFTCLLSSWESFCSCEYMWSVYLYGYPEKIYKDSTYLGALQKKYFSKLEHMNRRLYKIFACVPDRFWHSGSCLKWTKRAKKLYLFYVKLWICIS